MAETLESKETPVKVSSGEVDPSLRAPFLWLLGPAAVWLSVATILALLGSLKLVDPRFLGTWGWLTFGRISPAAFLSFVYGFGIPVGLSAALWAVTKGGRLPLLGRRWCLASSFLWNVGLWGGITGVLAGESRSLSWLGLPTFSLPSLGLGYLLSAGWLVAALVSRWEEASLALRFLLLGLVWIPWAGGAAALMLHDPAVRGVAMGSLEWWFNDGLLYAGLGAFALGIVYLLAPSSLGRPLAFSGLGRLAFWTWALFANLAGTAHLVGGPFPLWMVSLGVSSRFLLWVAAVAVGVGFWVAARRLPAEKREWDPSWHFLRFGMSSFLVAAGLGALLVLPAWSRYVHYTVLEEAQLVLFLYGFLGMTFFSLLYALLPQLLGRPWPSPTLSKVHFWLSSYGISFLVGLLAVGGLFQGVGLDEPDLPVHDVIVLLLPFLRSAAAPATALLAGHAVFGLHLLWLILESGSSRRGDEETALAHADIEGVRTP
ncbi:cbb3-type cytochrome c oxidase subunit I [Methylacidimicrobium tartarophylax]|uniref:Cytochrome c oxidase cbb3-type subunit I n=1 Tax=Methylacidimicrobium tartarophylax TaxID=1041768 RepID=A0A5E6MD90_9BACT|nr:cbb3-type cytochrome c oxidase subunit I [Methylacidimicrobium tartarophylax]VVM06306.1 cytochrome c oxidase cbb3-type subunit I [Methylacidimicrobium tartarophylax]